MDLKIIDNFLPDYQFKSIQKTLTSDMFPWNYNDCAVLPKDGRTMFTHTFYDFKPPWNGKKSDYFPLMEQCLPALNVRGLNRIMSVLTVKTVFNRRTPYHTDTAGPENIFTGVFYINTCLLYTSPSPRDYAASRMPSSA